MDTIGLHIPPSVLEYGTPVFNADERMERPRMETFRVKKIVYCKIERLLNGFKFQIVVCAEGGGGGGCVAWLGVYTKRHRG